MSGANGSAGAIASDVDHVVDYVGEGWNRLRGGRVFITGGTGFFGRSLLESFVEADGRHQLGARMTVLTRDPRGFEADAPHLAAHPAIELVDGDMIGFRFPRGAFNFVIHAATSPVRSSESLDLLQKYESDVEGTRRVVAFARERGAKRLLLTSSGAIYGRQPLKMSHIDEEYLGAPDTTDRSTAYGQAKRASEYLCTMASASGGLEAVIARCFAFVGPNLPLDSNYAVGNFIADALAGRPIRVSGDGTPLRSYLYVADLAVWLWTLLLRGQGGRAYNVGSDEAISIGSLARLVAAVVSPGTVVDVAMKPRSVLPVRYVPSTARARTELGLTQVIPLAMAIERTAAWHRRHRLVDGDNA